MSRRPKQLNDPQKGLRQLSLVFKRLFFKKQTISKKVIAKKSPKVLKKNLLKVSTISGLIRDRFSKLQVWIKQNYQLFLAIVFITPAAIVISVVVYSQLHHKTASAAPFTGVIKVSKKSTMLSTDGDWLSAMAFSGDGINGDGDYFNPIHPGSTTEGAAGTLAIGTVALPTVTLNNYDAAGAQFIPWQPNANGNNYGVIIALQNTNTVVNNTNIVVELVRFPTASYTGTPPSVVWSNYVACSAINTCTYPADTVIERQQVVRFDETISGEALYPGQYGIHYLDFRFDPPLAVSTSSHYGFRVYYNNLTTTAGWPRNGATKPLLNASNFGLGITNVDTVNASTATIPMANTTATSFMVALNSAPSVGLAVVPRTQNEHWSGTYSSALGNWAIKGSVSGNQSAKLTSPTNGGTGASWVNDGVAVAALTANATATTRLCVSTISGFAVNQYIDIWDAQTTSIQKIISAVNATDGSCSGGPSIIVTVALTATDAFTVAKNATVAKATWKLRIIQGGEETITQILSTTKFCVSDAAAFSVPGATYNNINLWDDDSAVGANRITAKTVDDAACTLNAGDDSITVATTVAAFTVAKAAHIAEISTNFSNNGTPADGAVFRFTSLNMGQNPARTGAGTTLVLLYDKVIAPATAATKYPWLANSRFPWFVAYGDAVTSAPADGDFPIIGAGAVDPDINDSTNLSNDLQLAKTSGHTVTVDKNLSLPMIYTGTTGGGVGFGTTTAATASYGGSGFVSALLTSRSKLAVANTADQRYRIVAPGRVLLSSDASLELGSNSSPLPKSTSVDLYLDSTGPSVTTTLSANCAAAATSCTFTSVDGFFIGDIIEIKDNDSSPSTFLISAINTSTKVVTFAAAVANYAWIGPVPAGVTYSTAQSATASRGIETTRPTGADRRAYIYGARGTGVRNNIYSKGDNTYRVSEANLAVDIDGSIDTGYLGAQQTISGDTWLDVASSQSIVGNWSPLDPISVSQGNNAAVNNNDSSLGLGANDDANAFPTWAGATTGGGTGTFGYNVESQYNTEMTEIGTIPMTDMYNADYNGGTVVYSSNYATAPSWTIFGNNANTEVNDAVYFGDRGDTPIYSLEFNIGTSISAVATRVWEYWNGSTWAQFTPKFAWKQVARGNSDYGIGEYCIPFSANPVDPTATVQLTDTNNMFTAGQIVEIKDSDSPTVIRRISSVTVGIPANIVFTEIIPTGYTTSSSAKVCMQNGGSWNPIDPSVILSQTGKTMISWSSDEMPNAAKTTVNSVSGYWVRNRISNFTSWTTSPTNQTTSVQMQGIENISSSPLTVSNSVNEAKLTSLSLGASFDPNETWVLRYNDNSTALSSQKTTRWYESQTTSFGTAHRWLSPNPDGESSAYYEKNSQEANWRSMNGDFSWTDQSVYTKVYMNQAMDATAGRRLGVFLRQDADDYGYAAYITKSTTVSTLGWYTTAAGAETAVGTATNITFNANTWYCIRAEANGTTLQAKFWSPVSEDADCNGDANEPGAWTESETSATYTSGRFGIAADTMLARFDDVTVKNTAGTTTLFNDNFNDTGCWNVIGSIHGSVGCAGNAVPFTSSYLNFTMKHKGGVQSGDTGANAVVGPLNAPEQGDEIYLTPLARASNIGLDETAGITTSNTNTRYENWDFVYNSTSGKWDANGSQSGSGGSATPGSTFTVPNSRLAVKIKTGTPAGPKFGGKAAYFQNSMTRGVGNFTGLNTQQSAVLIQPYWTVSGSSTQYNIEGVDGLAAQKGTIDFWFKPNFTGSPAYIQYLMDYAANTSTDRILVRLMPNGTIEAIVGPAFGVGANTKLIKNFSATAGQWYHFRLAWEDSDAGQLNMKRAWLDGAAFTTNQGSTLGARAANAGIIRLGNSWQYNAGFDGAIDEFAIFNDSVDTSVGDNWGDFTVPSAPWTGGQNAGTSTNIGKNIFLAHFDTAVEPQKGYQNADYFVGHPVMVFTNGADTISNDRIRISTSPARTRVWTDNTGSQYTPSARIKYSEGYALGAETGWGQSFQYHHRAASVNASKPISSVVLNLRKQIRLWSDEKVATINRVFSVNQSYGIVLTNPKALDVNNLEMDQTYYGFYISGNPQLTATTYPTQYITDSAFNNVSTNSIYTLSKTLGSQVFSGNNFASVDYNYYPFREDTSSNITVSNSNFMGYSAAGYYGYFSGGRVFTVSGNKFFSAYYPIAFTAGTAKVDLTNNEFWRFKRGITLNGNSFIKMSSNSFDGGTDSTATNGIYGTGIFVTDGTSNVEISDSNSYFGRSIWNEADISLPPNTTSWLAGSLLRYVGENSSFNSNFHYLGSPTQDKFGGEYLGTAIPGVDVRVGSGKDIINYSNYGIMRTTGADLGDTTVRTSGGYAWRLESTSKTDALEYTAKVVGVAGKPLAVTGYLRVNENYGTSNLPTVKISGLGMTGANLTWTASTATNTWQQFVVSGTPTESALATVTISVQSSPVVADSGAAENVDDSQGITVPTFIEDTDKYWTWNQWAGYKMRDDQGFVFDIVGNTATRLFVKGTRIPFGNVLATQPYGGAYEIYSPPLVYLDDISVLSGTVDTGTLDFFSAGQPVAPWLSTGLTAEGIWGAQTSTFANIDGSFGQLLNDSLFAKYSTISDPSPTTTSFNTGLDSTVDDYYNNGVVIFTEGNNKGVIRRIADYSGSAKTITLDPALPVSPSDQDRFAIIAATASASGGSGGATAAEIWSYVSRTLTGAALEGGGSLATAADVAAIRADIASVLTELGTGNISAIKTKTDSIDWANVTGLVTTAGEIKAKTDDITWSDIATIKTSTNSINWTDVTGIKLKTDTITWGDITTIKANVATLISEIGTGNISAIKTSTDSILWSDITGIVTNTGLIKAKTDTINWSEVTGIKTATDTIAWSEVTGIKAKTDTIAWGDITTIKGNVATLIGEIGTGNIAAIKTSTDSIAWADITGIVTNTGLIKTKTDTINWSEVSAVKTKTDTISWSDITGIQAKTDTINWGDVSALSGNLATVISEIGTGNIAAIRTSTDSIAWSDITGIVTNTGLVKAKTDSINWGDVVAINTATGTINWADITGIKAKTDTIVWSNISDLQTSLNALHNITAADVWAYGNKSITGISTSGAQAIWDSACSILNTSGSVGKLVCENLDAKVSSAGSSSLTAEQVWNYATKTITAIDTPALSAIANSVWSNSTKTLTSYGNDITAQNVWDVLTSSITTIDSIGSLLKTNVDTTISSRSDKTTTDSTKTKVDDISALVDVSISSRASQDSLDAHEAADAQFRDQTTNTLGTINLNVGAISTQLSTIDTKIDSLTTAIATVASKIDVLDTNLDSVKATVEDTNTKVTAIQSMTNDLIAKWGTYDAAALIGHVDTLESSLGQPTDSDSATSVFGKLNYIKNNSGGGGGGSNPTIDLIYAKAQETHAKMVELQSELGFNGKSTTAFDELTALKTYVDTVEDNLAGLNTSTASLTASVTGVSNELKTVTDRIGKVSIDSFTQLFEVKNSDIGYLKNKIIELKAMSDINRQLLEKSVNQPIVKVVMEWGSVIIKFVIVNPSTSVSQKIPFKAFLPKEVKQEYIMDLGGLSINYDATTEQYYVTADITLPAGESVTRSVEIKDIWLISEDEVASQRKQADEMAQALTATSYNAQSIVLKTDINTRLDKIARKQKDGNATPQDHILAYRENMEDMKAVTEDVKGLRDLVIKSGDSSNFLASIGGIQTFATWGVVLVLIFGMGSLGMFFYQLWKRRMVTVKVGTKKQSIKLHLEKPKKKEKPKKTKTSG